MVANAAIILGIVPQQSATKIAKAYLPFIKKHSEETGLSVYFATTKDIPRFVKCVVRFVY